MAAREPSYLTILPVHDEKCPLEEISREMRQVQQSRIETDRWNRSPSDLEKADHLHELGPTGLAIFLLEQRDSDRVFELFTNEVMIPQ